MAKTIEFLSTYSFFITLPNGIHIHSMAKYSFGCKVLKVTIVRWENFHFD